MIPLEEYLITLSQAKKSLMLSSSKLKRGIRLGLFNNEFIRISSVIMAFRTQLRNNLPASLARAVQSDAFKACECMYSLTVS
jgi:hypothetical protein